MIEDAYERADTERPERLFRFPYGERGEGKKKEKLQEVLKEKSFRKPVFEDITYEWWREKEQDKIDWFWTFDCMEYRIDDLNQILRRIQEEKPDKMKGITADSADIILIHDHSETHEKFQPVIKKLIESGVNFCSPLK